MLDTKLKLKEKGSREAERAVGERSEAAAGASRNKAPDPELVERPTRRRYSAEYKLHVVEEADRCSKPGEIGALVRRERIHSSMLTKWRRQRDEGALGALGRSRGRSKPDPLQVENEQLRRRAEKAEAELEKARKVMEVQGNVSALLEALLEPRSAGEDESTEK